MEEKTEVVRSALTPPRKRPRKTPRVKTQFAKTWHVSDGTGPDGKPMGEHGPAILAECDRCTEVGDKVALLRREVLYSSLLTDWRRQHRQGLLKAGLGRNDGERGRTSLGELNRLRAENERLKTKLAQAEA